MIIPLGRIALTPDKKVHRVWIENPDGGFIWRKRADHIWTIKCKNVAAAPCKKSMKSQQGRLFKVSDHSVTLDDFVFLYDRGVYVHVSTGCHFTARQINSFIFRDRTTWPARLMAEPVWPTVFIRRFNRVSQSAEFSVVMEALNAVA